MFFPGFYKNAGLFILILVVLPFAFLSQGISKLTTDTSLTVGNILEFQGDNVRYFYSLEDAQHFKQRYDEAIKQGKGSYKATQYGLADIYPDKYNDKTWHTMKVKVVSIHGDWIEISGVDEKSLYGFVQKDNLKYKH